MTVSVYGVDGSLTEASWAELANLMADPVVSGLAPSVTANSTRQVSIASGKLFAAGVMLKSDAAATVTLDANTGSNPRIDIVVAQINWSGTGGTGSFVAVKGANAATPSPPTLTQTEGTLWQVPLAAVTVQPGVGQIAAADVDDDRPSSRAAKVYRDVINSASIIPSNTTGSQRAAIAVPDPGWPYYLEVMGGVAFQAISSGRGVVIVNVDGTELTRGRTDTGAEAPAILRTEWTGVKNGTAQVSLIIASQNASSSLIPVAAQSGLTAVIHRA